MSYRQLAIAAVAPYYTQSPDPTLNRHIEAGGDLEAIAIKLQQAGYFPDPVRLWLGKSLVEGEATGDVFAGLGPGPTVFRPPKPPLAEVALGVEFSLGGPWGFYQEFWRAHELRGLRFLRPEIALRPNDT